MFWTWAQTPTFEDKPTIRTYERYCNSAPPSSGPQMPQRNKNASGQTSTPTSSATKKIGPGYGKPIVLFSSFQPAIGKTSCVK